jgi:hypothetical protein
MNSRHSALFDPVTGAQMLDLGIQKKMLYLLELLRCNAVILIALASELFDDSGKLNKLRANREPFLVTGGKVQPNG